MNGQEEFNYPGFGVDDVGHFLLRVRRQIAEPMNDDPNGMETDSLDGNNVWRDGFVSSFTMILLAEIADKTFFIAAILAMRYNKIIVFVGAYGALVIMTLLSCALGFVVNLIPSYITHYLAASLFAIFALQMLYEAYKNHGQSAQGEMEEVAAELREDDEELRVRFRKNSKTEGAHGEADIVVEILPTDAERARSRGSSSDLARERGPSSPEERRSLTAVAEEASSDSEEDLSCSKKIENFFSIFINAVFIKAFFLTFIAEWGDRSQLSTVTLATTTNMYAVFIGGCLGHFCCTLAAIIFGSTIAKRVSMTYLNVCGGLLFLGFSGYTFYLAATGEND